MLFMPLVRLALPGDSHMSDAMANHNRALDALKWGNPVAVRTAIEAGICGAASNLEEYQSE